MVKAVLYDPAKSFAVTEAPAPKPGAGEPFVGARPGMGRDAATAEVTRLPAVIHPAHPRRF